MYTAIEFTFSASLPVRATILLIPLAIASSLTMAKDWM